MAQVIPFSQKSHSQKRYPTFSKVVDGQTFECVDVDALSPRQREAFFEGALAQDNRANV
ncbi:hypothetical protein [Mesorhizobium sp. M0118]|uniref:hypothetical protein n=1 Tax=Mesorhizobium sp. M0118 TaxID=2956884 RepID=UPI0033365578